MNNSAKIGLAATLLVAAGLVYWMTQGKTQGRETWEKQAGDPANIVCRACGTKDSPTISRTTLAEVRKKAKYRGADDPLMPCPKCGQWGVVQYPIPADAPPPNYP